MKNEGKTGGGPRGGERRLPWRMAVVGAVLLCVLGGGAYALLVAVPANPDSDSASVTRHGQDARATLKDGQDAQPIPLHSSPFTLHSSPSLPIPWNALLRNSLPDGDFWPLEPEEPLLDLTDPEQLAAALHHRGETIPGLYRTLTEDQRGDLIAALNSTDMLRAHLAEFLAWEPRSDLRALMLECTDPAGFAAPEVVEPDAELIALLDLPTSTPIGPKEWAARMELASAIDPRLGAEWVRGALRAFPESGIVAFTASLITLVDGTSAGFYNVEERTQAAVALARFFNGREGADVSPETRIRAYYALALSPEPRDALAFFRARLNAEPDPRAREVLAALQARLVLRTTPLP